MRFVLEIELGNADMKSKADIRWALERIVERLYGDTSGLAAPFDSNIIRDINGNKVGNWGLRTND